MPRTLVGQRRTQLFRSFIDPKAIARERYDAAHEPANGLAIGPPRPADDADQRVISFLEHRTAGIAVADAEAGGIAELVRIDEAELLGAWSIGSHQRRCTQFAGGPAVSLHPDTEARDNESVADRRRRPALAERDRPEMGDGAREVDQSQIGRIGATRKLRMGGDVRDVLDRGAAAVERH